MSVARPTVNLDGAGAAALEKQLTDASGDLVIDLSDATFDVNSGLRVMLWKVRSSRGQADLVVVGADAMMLEVLKVSGFDHAITAR